MPSENDYFYRPGEPFGSWVKYFGVSLVLHFGVLALILVVPSGASVKTNFIRPQAIDISLVALNPDLPAPPTRGSAPAVRSVAASENAPNPSEKAAVKTEPAREPIPIKSSIKKELGKRIMS